MTRTLITLVAVILITGLFADGFVHAQRAEGKNLRDKFEKTVTNISNGVVIEITSDDAEAVEKIQERLGKDSERKARNQKANRPECDDPPKVERKVENISNGIRITITSDDPEFVERIQERAAKQREQGTRGGGRGAGQMRGRKNK